MKPELLYFRLLLTLPLALLFSCSVERNNILSKSWHNLTARDNAYFLARERLKDIDMALEEMRVEDYNQVLNILTPVDTNKTKSLHPKLEDILKKASLPIQKHKNSKWVDDCYVLIGKARIYKGEFAMAVETFKFVNSKSKDPAARHEALVQLMRTFLITEEYDNARAVSDYLRKQQEINKINTREYHLMKAGFNQIEEDYAKALENLEVALPLIKKKGHRQRTNFIMGQINQQLGKDAAAYKHYKAALKRHPPYELSFYTKLYLAQVSEVSNSHKRKKIEKYFRKLLKDQKNLEYKDKIYYEMAGFELKQNNLPKGIAYLEKSLDANTSNTIQRSYSYLKLGEIYYDQLQNYELAKAYYDSTVSVMNKSDKSYRAIAERQEILEEFVTQLRIIQREDSLQKLAKMDSVTLSKHIDKVIAFEEEQAKKALEREQARLKKQEMAKNAMEAPGGDMGGGMGGGEATWHFYNPAAIMIGKTEFTRKWGNRKLEDNWRRSKKESDAIEEEEEEAPEESAAEGNNAGQEEEAKDRKVDKQKYYKDIPFTKEQLIASDEKIENAMYYLGKIYNLKLNEQGNAIQTFEKLIERFPKSDYKPEVLYFLYIISKSVNNKNSGDYKARLLQEFPNSMYAKILTNPDYIKESKAMNMKAEALYKQAFHTYKEGRYLAADSLVNDLQQAFPETDINDKIQLLKILIAGQIKNALVYRGMLKTFIEEYNASPLLPRARELLAVSESFIDRKTQQGKKIQEEEVKYNINFDAPHYLLLSLDQPGREKGMKSYIDSYNRKNYKPGEINAEFLNLKDGKIVILVKEFGDKSGAMIYYTQLIHDKIFIGQTQNLNHTIFVINSDNFDLFLNSQNLDVYSGFFKENYF